MQKPSRSCAAYGLADEHAAPTPVSLMDARNRFIYEEEVRLTTRPAIREAVNSHPEWEPLEKDNGVKDAARRYATKFNLPAPPMRRRSRPPRNTK